MPVSRRVKTGVVGAVVTGLMSVAGLGAYNIWTALGRAEPPGTNSSAAISPISSQPPSAKEVEGAAKAFLAAWASGDSAGAARLTDSPLTATDALTAYRRQARVISLRLDPGTPSGTMVPFTVTARVSFQGITRTWAYGSSLTVVRGYGNKPVVQWAPSVEVPALKKGESIVTGEAESPVVDVLDRRGKVLDAAEYPSLARILAQLRDRYGAASKSAGRTALGTYIEDGGGVPVTTLLVLRPGAHARVRTTLDAAVQAAAERAVLKEPDSGVTALDTGTGGILAVAFSPSAGTDLALQGTVAPGSTFKVVTATALLAAGVTPSTPSPCVSGYARPMGKPYRNVSRDNPGATFGWDFANSCNTGFIRLAGSIGPGTLTDTGRRYYGLGATWTTGTSTSDGAIPGGAGDEMTSEMIGQGTITMTTLDMASVSATVREGRFHQPSILQDTSLIEDRTPIPTTALAPGLRGDLMQMMHRTVTSGTAYAALHTFGGTVGAKTGSAEAGTGAPNGWFTAYHGHVAAAALVLRGGEGVDSAGPIVASVLSAAS